MAKRQLFDNYAVRVFVPRPFGSRSTDHKFLLRETRSLEADIKRHIDHDGTDIDCEDVSECEHCGSSWSEDNDTYNGGCCDEDEKANPSISDHDEQETDQ